MLDTTTAERTFPAGGKLPTLDLGTDFPALLTDLKTGQRWIVVRRGHEDEDRETIEAMLRESEQEGDTQTPCQP